MKPFLERLRYIVHTLRVLLSMHGIRVQNSWKWIEGLKKVKEKFLSCWRGGENWTLCIYVGLVPSVIPTGDSCIHALSTALGWWPKHTHNNQNIGLAYMQFYQPCVFN